MTATAYAVQAQRIASAPAPRPLRSAPCVMPRSAVVEAGASGRRS